MKIMNQGLRTISFGTKAEEVIKANQVAIVTKAIGEKLLSLYKGEIVDLDNLSVSYDASAVKDFTKKAAPAGKTEGAAA
jgi:hypothetical protein